MPAGRTSVGAVRGFVDELERRLAPLDRAILLNEWRLTMGRGVAGMEGVQARRHRLLSPPALLDRIRHHRSLPLPSMLLRRLEIFERATLESQIEQAPEIATPRARLVRSIAAFRPRWHGRRVGRAVVRKALRTSSDRRERERAYRSEEPLFRPIEKELAALVVARNDRARAYGFRSFTDFRLSLEGSSVERMEALLEEALRFVPGEMRRRRAAFEEQYGESGWYPWDMLFAEQRESGLPDASFPGSSMLETVVSAIRRWGFPSSSFRFRTDQHDLAAGGICLAPDPPRDVRVIVHPGGGWESYRILFHEIGHALNSVSVRQPSSHLLRWHEHLPGFAGLAEGEGRFFEQIATSETWLHDRPRLGAGELAPALEGARRAPLASIAFLAGWVLRELTLYRDPAKDPSAGGVRFARRIFGFDAYEPLSFADSFNVELPVYSASYVFAELLRPQLTAAVLAEVGGELWPNARVGPWLVDRWFRDGSAYDWWTRLREMTGRPFGAQAFNAEMREVVG